MKNLKTSVTWIFLGPWPVFPCRLDNHSANYPNMACNRTLRRCEMGYWMTWALNSVQLPTWATNICQAWFWLECALFKRCLDCFLWLTYRFGDCYELLVFNQLWVIAGNFLLHPADTYTIKIFGHTNIDGACISRGFVAAMYLSIRIEIRIVDPLYNNYRVRSSQISKKSLKKISAIPKSYCSAVHSCQIIQIYQSKYMLRSKSAVHKYMLHSHPH